VDEEIVKESTPLSGSAASPLINPPFLFLESAILFESGFDTLCNRIIVIDAPEEIRIARVIARDYHGRNTTANIEKVRARIRTQRHHEGDLTIINDGQHPISELAEEIIKFIKNDI
jgi:dephospho-CoA kinase